MACFFFNDTATTEIYTLSLHDALPIYQDAGVLREGQAPSRGKILCRCGRFLGHRRVPDPNRSEEHTSELQSQSNLVCRLLLEKQNEKAHAQNLPQHNQRTHTVLHSHST